VIKDQKATKEKREAPVIAESTVFLDQKATKALLGLKAIRDLLDPKAIKAFQENEVQKATLVLRVNMAYKANKVRKAK
jgi:hypothetical protein